MDLVAYNIFLYQALEGTVYTTPGYFGNDTDFVNSMGIFESYGI